MDNLRHIGELAGLSKPEQSAIKSYLVEFDRDLSLVKSQFERDMGRRITMQSIKAVLTRNEVEIASQVKEFKTNPEYHKLFFLTERLKRWDELYVLCLLPDAVTMTLSSNQTKEKRDLKTAALVLKGAAWDALTWEKNQLDKQKLALLSKLPGADEETKEEEMQNVAGW